MHNANTEKASDFVWLFSLRNSQNREKHKKAIMIMFFPMISQREKMVCLHKSTTLLQIKQMHERKHKNFFYRCFPYFLSQLPADWPISLCQHYNIIFNCHVTRNLYVHITSSNHLICLYFCSIRQSTKYTKRKLWKRKGHKKPIMSS